MNAGVGSFILIHDRSGRIEQEAAILGAGQEQDAFVQAAPTVGDEILGRPVMVGQEDGVDTGAFRASASISARVPPVCAESSA